MTKDRNEEQKPKKCYEVDQYVTADGKRPYDKWLDGLKDKKALGLLLARAGNAAYGNFGDSKSIRGAKGLHEMRVHYGAGYRIFYTVIDDKLVLLLAGSIKRDQKKMIEVAKKRLADHLERSIEDDQKK